MYSSHLTACSVCHELLIPVRLWSHLSTPATHYLLSVEVGSCYVDSMLFTEVTDVQPRHEQQIVTNPLNPFQHTVALLNLTSTTGLSVSLLCLSSDWFCAGSLCTCWADDCEMSWSNCMLPPTSNSTCVKLHFRILSGDCLAFCSVLQSRHPPCVAQNHLGLICLLHAR